MLNVAGLKVRLHQRYGRTQNFYTS